MTELRQESYTLLRERLRWRVAVVLCALVGAVTALLTVVNLHFGIYDNAAMTALVCAGTIIAGGLLWKMPQGRGGWLFFLFIALMLVVVMAYGHLRGHPVQHWAYVFPPTVVFLLRSRAALAAMLAFGIYACVTSYATLSTIELIRFASGYSVLLCFMFTYALLQERAAEMLRFQSEHDALTNCLNRRTFNEALDELPTRGGPVSFVLIDIDHFKAINDTHGHLIGDRAITEVAACLGRGLDGGTPLYRYGGEEFALLLGQVTREEAVQLAQALRARVAGERLAGLALTVSIGVSAWPGPPQPVAVALDRADSALYQAKRGGRNRVEML